MSASATGEDVRALYQDVILRRVRHPLHHRVLDPFDAEAAGDNPMCGDRCSVRLRFGDHEDVSAVAFQGRGCAISMASADLMADAVQGRPINEVRQLTAEFTHLVKTGASDSSNAAIETLRPLSGVAEYPSRIKCATLPWAALIAALDGAKEASSE